MSNDHWESKGCIPKTKLAPAFTLKLFFGVFYSVKHDTWEICDRGKMTISFNVSTCVMRIVTGEIDISCYEKRFIWFVSSFASQEHVQYG